MLDDDVRLTRDVPSEMTGNKARILIVAAAGRIADHDRHGLATVEAVLRQRRLRREQPGEQGDNPGPSGVH
jgi:hypothetical protein